MAGGADVGKYGVDDFIGDGMIEAVRNAISRLNAEEKDISLDRKSVV